MQRTAQKSRRSRTVRRLALLIFLSIVGFQIAGPVPIGLGNNGDFARTLAPLSICLPSNVANDAHLYFHYFVNDYSTGCARADSGVPSSEWLVARLASTIGRVFLPAGTFKLSVIGLIHAAIFGLAFFVFLQAFRACSSSVQVLAAALVLFIWTDVRYVEQMNTAYPDTVAGLALLLLFSVAVNWAQDGDRRRWPVSFAIAGCFLLGAKTQHETALPFLLAFCLLAAVRSRRLSTRALWFAALLPLFATSVWMIRKTPDEYRAAPAYSVVFFKLAVLSPNPKRVLADFHMPEQEFLRHVGHYAYEREAGLDNPAFSRRIRSLVTPASLASFYARRPAMLGKVLWYDLTASAPDVDLTPGFGYRREPDVQSAKLPLVLTAWSGLRRRLFRWFPLHIVLLFVVTLTLSGLCMFKAGLAARLPLWPVTLMFTLIAVTSFLGASLLDSLETARHLTIFQTAMDLTILSLALSFLL